MAAQYWQLIDSIRLIYQIQSWRQWRQKNINGNCRGCPPGQRSLKKESIFLGAWWNDHKNSKNATLKPLETVVSKIFIFKSMFFEISFCCLRSQLIGGSLLLVYIFFFDKNMRCSAHAFTNSEFSRIMYLSNQKKYWMFWQWIKQYLFRLARELVKFLNRVWCCSYSWNNVVSSSRDCFKNQQLKTQYCVLKLRKQRWMTW